MSEVSAYELARLALILLDRHRDWTNSHALNAAYILWMDAKLCGEAMEGKYPPESKKLPEPLPGYWEYKCPDCGHGFYVHSSFSLGEVSCPKCRDGAINTGVFTTGERPVSD